MTRAVGPQVSTTDTSRPVSCTIYTALGNIAEIWAGSTTDTTSTSCNLADANLKKQQSVTYDDWGRKLTQTDQLGKTWKWTWNVHGELVTSQTPVQAAAGQTTSYAYGTKGGTGETQGQLKSRTVPGAQTASYTRNALGQVTKAETKDGANQTVVAYDYAYDAAHRLQTVTDSRANKSLTYTWTPGGRLARVIDSDGHSTSFAYDGVGRLSSLTAPNGENVSFVWDAGGRLIEKRLNSGLRTTQSWFEDGSLKDKKNLFSSTTLSSHIYTLDSQGRRATQTETINGTTKNWTYGYDNLDRLVSSSDGTAETTSYDIYGNRKTKSNAGTTTAYLYDLAHQLSEIRQTSDTGTLIGGAVHDADGHLTKLCEGTTATRTATDCTSGGTGATTLNLAWDALDHLLTATRTGANAVAESYAYDDSGRRLKKTSAGSTTHYGYDGDDIHAEWAGTLAGMPAAVYAHGVGVDEPLLRLTGSTNSPAALQTAYLQDGLGSVVGTVNSAGTLISSQRFDAWGNKGATTGTTPTYGFTGREPDQTGLTYFRARYQHPGIGRFLSRDPAGMADAVSPYAYVRNSPTNLVDPFGLTAQIALPGNLSAYPADQLAFCLPCLQTVAATMTDIVAGVIGVKGTPGYQGVQGRTADDNLLTTPNDSGNSGLTGQIGGFVNGALQGLQTLIQTPGKAIENFQDNVFGGAIFKGGESEAAADGRRAHGNYGTALGDQYDTRVTLPSGKKPDAVNWDQREVRELKPDNSAAVRRGEKQVEGYRQELEAITGQPWTSDVDVYRSRRR